MSCITGKLDLKEYPHHFLSFFGITPESKAKVLQTTAQEDLEAQIANEASLQNFAEGLEKNIIPNTEGFVASNPIFNTDENSYLISPYDNTKKFTSTPLRQNGFSVPSSSILPKMKFFSGSRGCDMKPLDKLLQPYNIEPMNKELHLAVAVVNRINHIHSLKVNFSAYDVTTSLREAVKDGVITLKDEGLDYEIFDGVNAPVIRHTEVRDIVKELFAENLIPDYVSGYGKQNGQSYVEYKYTGPAVLASVATAPLSTVNSLIQNVGNAAVQAGNSIQALNHSLKSIDSEMWRKARYYVDGKNGATAKQIQSRLKGYNVTCREIVDMFSKLSSYDTQEDMANVSKSFIS